MDQAPFDELVVASVRESMSKVLGGETWKTIELYFDLKLIARDPDKFTQLLDRIFGATSRVIQRVIVEAIMSRVGGPVERVKGKDFRDCIQMAKARFASPFSR